MKQRERKEGERIRELKKEEIEQKQLMEIQRKQLCSLIYMIDLLDYLL